MTVMSRARVKHAIALGVVAVGAGVVGRLAQRCLWGKGHVRGVNYHDTPLAYADEFRRQMEFYTRHFVPVGPDDLTAMLEGRWPHNKPGLLLSFDDGLASNARVAAPILEEYGWVGWFFVLPGLIEAASSMKRDETLHLARRHRVFLHPETASGDDGVFMTWEDVSALDRRHVIGCHTMNHCWLAEGLSDDQLRHEIVESRALLGERLGHPVESFCWVGGEESSYSRRAAEYVREAGYTRGFMTNLVPSTVDTDPLQIQRTNIEADWPDAQVKLYLSGLMDILYLRKKRRVNAVTNVGSVRPSL